MEFKVKQRQANKRSVVTESMEVKDGDVQGITQSFHALANSMEETNAHWVSANAHLQMQLEDLKNSIRNTTQVIFNVWCGVL